MRDWDAGRARYACADGAEVRIRGRVPDQTDSESPQRAQRSVIIYRPRSGDDSRLRLFVSDTELGRDMSVLVEAGERARTATFPRTVVEAMVSNPCAWYGKMKALRSVVLNEGLARLGRDTGKDEC